MAPEWTQQLHNAGFNLGTPTAPSPLPTHFCAVASQYRLVRIKGPDTLRFLQGQLTCDINNLSPERSTSGAACTPKGRAYAVFQLALLAEDEVLLRLPAAIADDVINHMKKYLAFFKAEMTPAESWLILGLSGLDAAQSVVATELSQDTPGRVHSISGGIAVCLPPSPEGTPQYELWLNTAQLSALPEIAAPPVSSAAWHLALIRSGLVTLTPETAGEFVPQNLNLHAVDGISFKKGCYTGQEVVARMHYLGKLKKSMFRLSIQGAIAPPAIGDAIADADGKNLGTLVDVINDEKGVTHGLAVLSHQVLTATAYLAGQPETTVTLEPMSYQVPEQVAVSE